MAILGWIGLRAGEYWLASTTVFRDTLRDEIALRFAGEVAVSSAKFRAISRVVEARDVVLSDRRAGEPQIVVPTVAVKLPYSIVDEHLRIAPERVLVKGGFVRLVERLDGSFAPLDLIRVVPTAIPVPSIAIEDGSVVLSGSGALNALLDGILRADLPRRVEKVRLASAPMPETSDYLIGFNGNLELPGVAPVTLFGGIGRDNSMRLELELRDLDLAGRSLRQTLAPALAAKLDEHLLGGKVTIEVELGLSAAAGADPRIRIHLHARDLVLRHPVFFARDLSGISLEASYDGKDFRIHELTIPDRGGAIAIDGVVEDVIGEAGLDFSDFRFTARGADLSFTDSLAGDLKEPMLRQIIDDYAPEGRAEFFLEISRARGGKLRPVWSLKPKRASASYVGHVRADGSKTGFPYRVTDLVGEISGDGPYVEIRRLRGRHAGGGPVEIDGAVDASGEHAVLDLRVKAIEAPLADNKLRDALEHVAAGAGAIVDRFHPTGTVDADVHVWVDPITFVTHREGLVRARSLDARIDDFPYPLHFEKGSVAFTDTTYTIDGLEAKAGAMEVAIDGRVFVVENEVGLEVSIEAKNARAQDPVLRRAVNDMLARVKGDGPPPFEWSWLEPAGGFDAAVELRQEPGDALRFSALLFPRDLSAAPKWFAVPIEGVAGRIEFGTLDPDTFAPRALEIELDDLRGRYRDGEVAVRGRVEERGLADLAVRGAGLPITGELLRAVAAATDLGASDPQRAAEPSKTAGGARALEEAAKGVVAAIAPGGRTSVRFDRRGIGDDAVTRLDLVVDGGRVESGHAPGGVLGDVAGRFAIDLERGSAVARDVSAKLLASAATLRSHRIEVGATDEAVTIEADLRIEGLPLDARAAEWLPSPLDRRIVGSRGTLAVAVGSASIVVEPEQDATRMRFVDATLSVADAALSEPAAISELHGGFRAAEASYTRAGDRVEVAFDGRVEGVRGRIGGLALDSVAAFATMSPRGLAVDRVLGRVAGGDIEPARTRVTIDAESGIRGEFALTDADLTTLLEQIGIPSADTRGRFDVALELSGAEPSLASLGGSGTVRIRDGRLADIPWIATIYRRTLGYVFGEWLEPTFSSGEIAFERDGDRIRLTRIRLDSLVPNVPLGLRLTGDGELGSTGIDLEIVPEILKADDRLILAPILRALTRPLFSYRVTGSLANPRVSYRNMAMELLVPLQDDTNRPRLVEPRKPDWNARF